MLTDDGRRPEVLAAPDLAQQAQRARPAAAGLVGLDDELKALAGA
jgi:hypothetical protein